MADFQELVDALDFLVNQVLEKKFNFTRGLLGDGSGNVDVPGRDGFSYVRPHRGDTRVIQLFNKMVTASDGTPIIIGAIPWLPGLQQVLGVDWETYMTVGWDNRLAGISKHARSHERRDFFVGEDSLNVYTRMMFPLRAEAVGSGTTSVIVSPYELSYQGAVRAWPGSPGIDLSPAIPSTSGQARYALVYWDYQSSASPYGALGVASGTLAPISTSTYPPKPAAPRGTIPSAYVYLYYNQGLIKDENIKDARPPFSASSFAVDDVEVSKLVSPDGTLDVVEADNDGNATIADGDLIFGTSAAVTSSGTLQFNATGGIGFDANGAGTFNALKIDANDDVIINDAQGGADFLVRGDGATSLFFVDATNEAIIINESGEDVDFRIESDNLTAAFFVQGSDGDIGIGTSTPATYFHVLRATGAAGQELFRLESSNETGFFSMADGASTGFLPIFVMRSQGVNGFGSDMIGYIPVGNDTLVAGGAAVVIEGRQGTGFPGGTTLANANLFQLQNFGSPRVTVTASGSMGIGVTAPLGKGHIDQASTTGAIPVLYLDQADLSEEFIEFASTVGAGNPIDTAAVGTFYGKIRVSVAGVGFKYIALYNS